MCPFLRADRIGAGTGAVPKKREQPVVCDGGMDVVVFANGLQEKRRDVVSEVTEKRTKRRLSYLAGIGLAGALAITTASGTLARLEASEASPARGHAQVIAHGVARL